MLAIIISRNYNYYKLSETTQTKKASIMIILPPHEANDTEKLSSMIDDINNGKELPAILVNGYQAYSGSHRLAAWEATSTEPNVIEISDEDFMMVCNEMCIDPIYDEITDFEYFLDIAKSLGFANNCK